MTADDVQAQVRAAPLRSNAVDKKMGYIVVDEAGRPMWAENRRAYPEARGVLYKGRRVTVFPTKSKALTAIQRTAKYSADRGFPWPTHKYRVAACVS